MIKRTEKLLVDEGLKQICGRWKKPRSLWLDKKKWIAQNMQERTVSRRGVSLHGKPTDASGGVAGTSGTGGRGRATPEGLLENVSST